MKDLLEYMKHAETLIEDVLKDDDQGTFTVYYK